MNEKSNGYCILCYTLDNKFLWATENGLLPSDSDERPVEGVIFFDTIGFAIGHWLTYYPDTPVSTVSFSFVEFHTNKGE